MKKPIITFEEVYPDAITNPYLMEMFKLINYRRQHPVETDISITDKDIIQYHHIIQKFYYKQKKLKIDNSDYNLIGLKVSEHVQAHCYLYQYYLSKGNLIMAEANERYLFLQARQYIKQDQLTLDAFTPDILNSIELSVANYKKKLRIKFKNGVAATHHLSQDTIVQMHKNQGKAISGQNNPMAGSKRIKLIDPISKHIKIIGVFPGQVLEDCLPKGYIKFSDYVYEILKTTIQIWEIYGRGEAAYSKAISKVGKTEFSQTYRQFRSIIYHQFPERVKIHNYTRQRKYDVKILKQIADDFNSGATESELFKKYGKDMPKEPLHIIMKRHGIHLINRNTRKDFRQYKAYEK